MNRNRNLLFESELSKDLDEIYHYVKDIFALARIFKDGVLLTGNRVITTTKDGKKEEKVRFTEEPYVDVKNPAARSQNYHRFSFTRGENIFNNGTKAFQCAVSVDNQRFIREVQDTVNYDYYREQAIAAAQRDTKEEGEKTVANYATRKLNGFLRKNSDGTGVLYLEQFSVGQTVSKKFADILEKGLEYLYLEKPTIDKLSTMLQWYLWFTDKNTKIRYEKSDDLRPALGNILAGVKLLGTFEWLSKDDMTKGSELEQLFYQTGLAEPYIYDFVESEEVKTLEQQSKKHLLDIAQYSDQAFLVSILKGLKSSSMSSLQDFSKVTANNGEYAGYAFLTDTNKLTSQGGVELNLAFICGILAEFSELMVSKKLNFNYLSHVYNYKKCMERANAEINNAVHALFYDTIGRTTSAKDIWDDLKKNKNQSRYSSVPKATNGTKQYLRRSTLLNYGKDLKLQFGGVSSQPENFYRCVKSHYDTLTSDCAEVVNEITSLTNNFPIKPGELKRFSISYADVVVSMHNSITDIVEVWNAEVAVLVDEEEERVLINSELRDNPNFSYEVEEPNGPLHTGIKKKYKRDATDDEVSTFKLNISDFITGVIVPTKFEAYVKAAYSVGDDQNSDNTTSNEKDALDEIIQKIPSIDKWTFKDKPPRPSRSDVMVLSESIQSIDDSEIIGAKASFKKYGL